MYVLWCYCSEFEGESSLRCERAAVGTVVMGALWILSTVRVSLIGLNTSFPISSKGVSSITRLMRRTLLNTSPYSFLK
ncbi:hypothetical protein E2C01_032536 [Portunus trituberculatus]|uniref:Uncharacterized protein n=1 Tax=Portunus trituberculatus TaxID=210409 RepID=A0A5B7F0J3_PORTR|nr:hypothetical protein [Portunus trituberculatus]